MKYSEFKPSDYDGHITFDEDREDWLVVPVNRNRDSGILDESNFEAALKILGGESDTVEIHRFGHWACGWFEIILADPKHGDVLVEMQDSLEGYPVLDEEDHSQREYDAINEAWDQMALSDQIEYAVENGHSKFAARPTLINASGEVLREGGDAWSLGSDAGDAPYSLIRS